MKDEIRNKFNEVNKLALDNICWCEGTETLFGKQLMTEQDAVAEITVKGKQALLHKVLWQCNCYKEGAGFDKWLKEKVKPDELPKYISAEALADYFNEELQEIYAKERKEYADKQAS